MTDQELLTAIARRVLGGEFVGVEILSREFSITPGHAADLMAMDWGAEVRRLESGADRLGCRHCGETYTTVFARATHERWCDVILPPEPVMLVPPPPTRCPRCAGRLIASHGELFCIAHGEVYAPVRPWEMVEGASAFVGPDERPHDRTRARGARTPQARIAPAVAS